MDSRTLLPAAAFRARALLLGARLELRNWPESETLARMPLAVRLPGSGVAVLFRYGVAVLFGVTAEDEHALREKLAPFTVHRYPAAEVEELEVRVDESRAEGLLEGAPRPCSRGAWSGSSSSPRCSRRARCSATTRPGSPATSTASSRSRSSSSARAASAAARAST